MPFQLVTMGNPIADFANELFAANEYREYLEVHGIGVQLTEALAEYWHSRVRSELKLNDGGSVADFDPEDKTKQSWWNCSSQAVLAWSCPRNSSCTQSSPQMRLCSTTQRQSTLTSNTFERENFPAHCRSCHFN